MPFSNKNKNPAARITSKRQDFLTKKGISTANPSDVSEGAVLLAYIYSIPDFSAGANFYRIFLPAMDGSGILHCWLNFCRHFLQKKKPCIICTARVRQRKKPLLPQIHFNTKPVKLQAANGKLCIQYIILSPKYNSKAAKPAVLAGSIQKNRPQ